MWARDEEAYAMVNRFYARRKQNMAAKSVSIPTFDEMWSEMHYFNTARKPAEKPVEKVDMHKVRENELLKQIETLKAEKEQLQNEVKTANRVSWFCVMALAVAAAVVLWVL